MKDYICFHKLLSLELQSQGSRDIPRKSSLSTAKSSQRPVDFSDSDRGESEYETDGEDDERSPPRRRAEEPEQEYEEEEEEEEEYQEEAERNEMSEEEAEVRYSYKQTNTTFRPFISAYLGSCVGAVGNISQKCL